MIPSTFKAQNLVIAKNQPPYLPLPVHAKARSPEGEVTSCWKGTWRDRLRFALTGRIYVTMLTFGQRLQPLRVDSKFELEEAIEPSSTRSPD